jgi:hypothetical protein
MKTDIEKGEKTMTQKVYIASAPGHFMPAAAIYTATIRPEWAANKLDTVGRSAHQEKNNTTSSGSCHHRSGSTL